MTRYRQPDALEYGVRAGCGAAARFGDRLWQWLAGVLEWLRWFP